MNKIYTIAKKEFLDQIFSSQIYICSLAFIITLSYFFINNIFITNKSDLNIIFNIFPYVALVFVSTIATSSFSQEFNSGTIELLMTLPFKKKDIILGKYFGNLILYTVMLSFTFIFPLFISIFGYPDKGLIIANYLAALALGGVILAISLFSSSLTKSNLVSFIISFIISFVMICLSYLNLLFDNFIVDFLNRNSIIKNYNNISKGIISTQSITYFLSLICLFLYFTKLSLGRRS